MPQRIGKDTIFLPSRPRVLGHAALGGKKEAQGPLSACFDQTFDDTRLGMKTWEQAESKLQTEATHLALDKAALAPGDVQAIFAGDLLNQCISSTFGLRELNIPFIGQYGACSTMAQSASMAALFVDSGVCETAAAVTSSHFCTAERQFRLPPGIRRPAHAHGTVDGNGSRCADFWKKRGKSLRRTRYVRAHYRFRD